MEEGSAPLSLGPGPSTYIYPLPKDRQIPLKTHPEGLRIRQEVRDSRVRKAFARAYRRVCLVEKAERVEACGTQYYRVWCDRDGWERARVWRCGDRNCPTCARIRARRLMGKYKRRLAKGELRMLVLTVPNVGKLTREEIERIRAYFTKLRRRVLWTRSVSGGLYALEMTRGRKRDWHPHFHVVLEGGFLDWAKIQREWSEIVGTYCNVWIGKIEYPEEALKYICKPSGEMLEDVGALVEFLEATMGKQLVAPLGSWREKAEEEEGPLDRCPECGGVLNCEGPFPIGYYVEKVGSTVDVFSPGVAIQPGET